MTLKDFIDKWNGKPCDFDGIYGTQCMDLMHFFVYEFLGLTDKTILAAPGAAQVWSGFKWDTYFEKITNTPDNHPEPGDIVLWDTTIGPYGHVAICWDATTDSFNSFDANWPVGSLPHIQHHDYYGVAGWLRAKPQAEQTVAVPSNTFSELVRKSTEYDKFVNAGYTSISDINVRVNTYETQLDAADYQVEHLTKELQDQQKELTDKLLACEDKAREDGLTGLFTYTDDDVLLTGLGLRLIKYDKNP